MARLSNPIAFTRGPVTLIITSIYVALITILILIQTGVPSPPRSPTPVQGINLTEAWDDLQLLTAQYRPYNSKRNDVIHDWLLSRIHEILSANNASSSAAVVFEDNTSNLTFSSAGSGLRADGISVYFEGTNIIVYIRGTDDDKKSWWKDPKAKPSNRNGVLVNAHYDSVSTGYGSTDDGVGVICLLQLIKYYSKPSRKLRNGIVLLFNNGEEDFLNGAYAFSKHPMANFISTFLNLEGAGAGGRAALFRSTDEEVTKAYAKSPYPFGTVISGDAFNMGLVRSQTDYVVFNGILGYRGLDVAFIGPRARYHTDQDDSRHTGKNAMWHMLSATLATTKELTNNKAFTINGSSHRSIWFDVFGRAFAVIQTHTFFALSVSLLVIGPLLLLGTLLLLHQLDRLYLFSGSRQVHTSQGDEPISLYGWRGVFRFPFIFLLSCAAPIALAYLMFKQNPLIAHSSEWAVWSMMISSFVVVAWFVSRFADFIHPSALTRTYGFGWMCFAWWVFLIVAVAYEEQFHLSGGYFTLIFAASTFVATFLSYMELLSLPKKSQYCSSKLDDFDTNSRSRSTSRTPAMPQQESSETRDDDEDEEPTEQSSLLRSRGRSAFKNYSSQGDQQDASDAARSTEKGEHEEQEWSKSMWNWLWILQFLIIGPINIILIGQLGLYLVEALHQTGQDGSSMFIVYLGMAVVTIILFSPLVPMIHRFTWHIPTFLFLVLIGTLIYNLLAFPFSMDNRLKVFFQQQIDLDLGNNTVSLTGMSPFVQSAVGSIPGTGQRVFCVKADTYSSRTRCTWNGLAPALSGPYSEASVKKSYKDLLSYKISLIGNDDDLRTARFVLGGKNTRACKLEFDTSVSKIHVKGQSTEDKDLPAVSDPGSRELRLWSRTWNRTWTVDVSWNSNKADNLTGKVVCLWSDVNQNGVIPAYDLAHHFLPEWIALTKLGDGLVEGYKQFTV